MGDICLVIVEDDVGLAELFAAVLEDEGYRCTMVTDSAQAVSTIRRVKPAAVLLDLLMPDPDGREIARQLRATPATRETPIIIVSGFHHVEEAAAEMGTPWLIGKPFELSYLLYVVGRAVAGQLPLTGS